jgi:hypothetical protein
MKVETSQAVVVGIIWSIALPIFLAGNGKPISLKVMHSAIDFAALLYQRIGTELAAFACGYILALVYVHLAADSSGEDSHGFSSNKLPPLRRPPFDNSCPGVSVSDGGKGNG